MGTNCASRITTTTQATTACVLPNYGPNCALACTHLLEECFLLIVLQTHAVPTAHPCARETTYAQHVNLDSYALLSVTSAFAVATKLPSSSLPPQRSLRTASAHPSAPVLPTHIIS